MRRPASGCFRNDPPPREIPPMPPHRGRGSGKAARPESQSCGSIPHDRLEVRTGEIRPTWTELDRCSAPGLGVSTPEYRPHLEVADGQGRLLEQTGQLRLDDLGGTQHGAVVDDEDFLVAGRRHRLGAEPAPPCRFAPSTRSTGSDHGTGITHGDIHGVFLRHLKCTLLEGGIYSSRGVLAVNDPPVSNPHECTSPPPSTRSLNRWGRPASSIRSNQWCMVSG